MQPDATPDKRAKKTATTAQQTDEVKTPARRGRKPAAVLAPEASVSVTEEAPVKPATKRGRKAAPIQTAPDVAPVATDEPVSPIKPARRGRKAAATPAPDTATVAETEAAPAVIEVTPATPEADVPAPAPKRGRKAAPRAAEVQAEASTPEVHAEPEAEVTEGEAVAAEAAPAEPTITPVPKRRGRKPRQAADVVQDAPPEALETGAQTTDQPGDEPRLPEPVQAGEPDVAEEPEAEQQAPAAAPQPRRGRGRRTRSAEPLQPEPVTLESAPSEPDQVSEPVEPAPAPTRTRRTGRKARATEAAAPVELTPEEPAEAEGTQETSTDSDPARELVVDQLRRLGRPVHVRDFERSFTRQGRDRLGEHRNDLEALLSELVSEGLVIRTRKRTYGLPEAMNLVRGRYQASSGGFGFVIPDSGEDDYYIPEGSTLEAWNGDTVLIRPEGKGRRGDSPRGTVVRVVKRANLRLVGSLEHAHGYAFLKPDDTRARHRIMLVPEGLEGLPDGARLVTELYWPEATGEDEVYGQLVRVLGEQDDPETETQAVVVKYGLRDEFPPEVLQEAEAIPVEIPEAALSGRLDLREYNIFTVDGRDAKDFDDAIHIQPTPEGNFVLGVHIADVSHYVRAGTPLDEEAYARATSVYLPGRVLPMLPEHLSNGVCSLVPDQDRLTVSALIELNIEGDILNVHLAPSVIRSKARLTYDEVQAYSEAVATLPERARALEGDLHLLLKLTSRLRQRRLREGSLDFKLREVKVDVGPDGHMQLIPVREETARGMIEDLMLLANKVVANHLIERNIPALFRIHEEPTLARFQEVTAAIGRLGLAFPGGEPTPQAYQAVLKQVRGTGQESAVNTLLLRSMQQARYAGENLGHFGLAFDEYLHFTSPIRRYPDLLVHRVLKAALSGELTDRDKAQMHARLGEMGTHTSERERTAAEAERDLTKYYQAKWAQEHLGETFEGFVSGVVASGLFVALENGVEGKVHISNLEDDYFIYIEDAGILKGRSGGRVFRIGERIGIQIASVNPLARQIEFKQESSMDGNDPKPRARRREDRDVARREKLSIIVNGTRPQRPADAQPTEEQGSSPRSEGGRPRQPQADGAQGRRERQPDRPRSNYGGNGGGGKRRIITLERPRNEHLRPVNVTVQRMYFGDWTMDNMPPEEGQNGGGRSGNFRSGRPQGQPVRNSSGPGRGGYQGQGRNGASSAQPRVQAQAQPAAVQAESAESSSKRRRRRRGRRGGNGGPGTTD